MRKRVEGGVAVLVVEDSPVTQQLLGEILGSDPAIRIVGIVSSGEEALSFLERHQADVVLMDIHLPGMDGLEVTRRIMETKPIPVVVCSAAADPGNVVSSFKPLEAGAVAVVAKPGGPGSRNYDLEAGKLVETVKLMSEVKVVRRWPKGKLPTLADYAINGCAGGGGASAKLVAIGASTGGPPVLQTILADLPKSFAAPILIVQHIAKGFIEGMAEWLTQSSGFPVEIAAHEQRLAAGRAYLAPDDYQMGLGSSGEIVLSKAPPEHGMRPSVSYLFRSVSKVQGRNAVAVLLTGMGKDGAVELAQLKKAGATTIAQDQKSSVVHGMPGEAIRLGGVSHVLSPEKIAPLLVELTSCESRRGNR
jgi:two-component system, chemotaxis family, protein-glutamate methylesterase/glutaminase